MDAELARHDSTMVISTYRQRDRVFTVLAIAALFQALLPLLTLPTFVQTASGEVVLLCSLQGSRQLVVKPEGEDRRQSHYAGTQCPVCLHNQASHAPLPGFGAVAVQSVRRQVHSPDRPLPRYGRSVVLAGSPIRAPPVV
jgi:hypothetical protein